MTVWQAKNVRVGLLVAIALGLLMAGTFFIGRERRFWETKFGYDIRFQRTNGLREGAPVSLSGVDVGSVSDISFPDDPNAGYILVSIEVSRNAATRIRTDTVARILTQGLLGDKYVDLSPGSPEMPELAEGSTIQSEDPIDYEKLLGRGGDIISNIVEASTSLKNVFGAIDRGEGLLGQMLRNREQGTAIVDDLQKTIDHLANTTASIEQMAKEIQSGKGAFGVLLKRGDEVESALAHLDRAAASVDRVGQRLESARGAVPRLLEDEQYANALLGDLRQAAADLAAVSQKANRGDGTLGKLVNDPGLYDNANEFVTEARTSWVFTLYRGLRGLFPPYSPPDQRRLPEAFPTPNPGGGYQWWAAD